MYLNPQMKVDLHIHTSASDGTWNVKQLMKHAKSNKVGLISITDHDTTANLNDAIQEAKAQNILFIKGVEISSTYNNELFHILGYMINENDTKLNDLISHNRDLLDEKDDNTIKMLIKNGYKLDYDEYESYVNDNNRGGWKALNFLIDKRICKDVGDFFARIFVYKNSIRFPQFEHPKKVIEIIKSAGGVPILAHPYYSHTDEKIEHRLSTFYNMGIEGFECYHPNHSISITNECVKWCRNNDVLITAGSDCHGEFIKTRKIGNPNVYIKDINLGKIERLIK